MTSRRKPEKVFTALYRRDPFGVRGLAQYGFTSNLHINRSLTRMARWYSPIGPVGPFLFERVCDSAYRMLPEDQNYRSTRHVTENPKADAGRLKRLMIGEVRKGW